MSSTSASTHEGRALRPRSALGGHVARIARELHTGDPQATVDAAVRIAARDVRGCDAAATSLLGRRGVLETPSYSDVLALRGELLQARLGEGPGLDSLRRKRVVQSLDIATDTRWPAWGPCVAHGLGARSVLCLRLYADDSTIGVLRLYARRAEAFDEQDREDGVILAAYVALAVATSRQLTNLTRALDSRTMIAQACGVLMERFRLGPSAAFAALVRISSESNRKLRDVAAELVETGVLPESVREQD